MKQEQVMKLVRDLASPPVRGRGLKHGINITNYQKLHVAPRAGAWIETNINSYNKANNKVAPRAGAWIETFFCL